MYILEWFRRLFLRKRKLSLNSVEEERKALSPLDDIIIDLKDTSKEERQGSSYSFSSFPLLGAPIDELRRYFASLPKEFLPDPRLHLPPRASKKRAHAIDLVLDLDETLVHSTMDDEHLGWGFRVDVKLEHSSFLYYVHKRPHLDYFIEVVSHWYNLVICTASLESYASQVISRIDRGRGLFPRRCYRQHCIPSPTQQQHWLKDLRLINPNLARICLLDNSKSSFLMYPENGIPIKSWLLDPNDKALLEMLPFLDALRFTNDVRSLLSLRL